MRKARTQTLAGFIRQHLDAIEARLAVGVRQEALLAELAAEGYETTLKNLRNELCRARRKLRSKIAGIPVSGPTVAATGIATQATSHALSDRITETQPVTTHPQPVDPTVNPLQKPAGFDYRGTQAIDINDLV